ncbi:MAG: hypothetical protein EOP09_01260 [Proteobacteria bacterium]|nr:MAG: hypothetical protein EOP09_01260 [Pseudomonadota bacterium]
MKAILYTIGAVPLFALGLMGCQTSAKKQATRTTTESLQFGSVLQDDPQIEKVLSRFCDPSYVAIQSTQEISSAEVMDRFEQIRALRQNWKTTQSITELTQASFLANRNAHQVIEAFDDVSSRLKKGFPEEVSAELTKVALVSGLKPSEVVSRFDDFKGARKWKSLAAVAELTKMSIFGGKTQDQTLLVVDEFAKRQGSAAKEMELVELTKARLLTGKSVNDILKNFDQIESRNQGFVSRVRVAELTRIAAVTGASPKSVFYRFAELSMRKTNVMTANQALELTKFSILSRKSANEVAVLFDRLVSTEKTMSFSLLSGEILQDSTFGAAVDECNGGYARLLMTVDSYRGG